MKKIARDGPMESDGVGGLYKINEKNCFQFNNKLPFKVRTAQPISKTYYFHSVVCWAGEVYALPIVKL